MDQSGPIVPHRHFGYVQRPWAPPKRRKYIARQIALRKYGMTVSELSKAQKRKDRKIAAVEAEDGADDDKQSGDEAEPEEELIDEADVKNDEDEIVAADALVANLKEKLSLYKEQKKQLVALLKQVLVEEKTRPKPPVGPAASPSATLAAPPISEPSPVAAALAPTAFGGMAIPKRQLSTGTLPAASPVAPITTAFPSASPFPGPIPQLQRQASAGPGPLLPAASPSSAQPPLLPRSAQQQQMHNQPSTPWGPRPQQHHQPMQAPPSLSRQYSGASGVSDGGGGSNIGYQRPAIPGGGPSGALPPPIAPSYSGPPPRQGGGATPGAAPGASAAPPGQIDRDRDRSSGVGGSWERRDKDDSRMGGGWGGGDRRASPAAGPPPPQQQQQRQDDFGRYGGPPPRQEPGGGQYSGPPPRSGPPGGYGISGGQQQQLGGGGYGLPPGPGGPMQPGRGPPPPPGPPGRYQQPPPAGHQQGWGPGRR